MGAILSSVSAIIQRRKPYKIIMAGIDESGKTTLLYRLLLGVVIKTLPANGVNVETVTHDSVRFKIMEIMSHRDMRASWPQYFRKHAGLIYVVDSTDLARLDEARDELHNLLSYDELEGCPVLVLANKQDLPHAASPTAVSKAFEMETLEGPWCVQGTSAITANGLLDALDWLEDVVVSQRKERRAKLNSYSPV